MCAFDVHTLSLSKCEEMHGDGLFFSEQTANSYMDRHEVVVASAAVSEYPSAYDWSSSRYR